MISFIDGEREMADLGDLDDGVTLVCECKWSSSPIGVGVYYDLMRRASLLPPPRENALKRYALLSAAGFDDNLAETAARDDVLLVSGDDLLDTEEGTRHR
jgi:hypothetical protein